MTRIERLIGKLQEKKIDLFLVVSDKNIEYLTGFTGGESRLLVSPERVVLITDGRFIEQAKQEVTDDVEIYRWSESLAKDTAQLINESNKENVQFEPDQLTYSEGKIIRETVKFPMAPVSGIVEEMRAVKDETEIAKIVEAAKIVDATFYHMLDFIKPGMTERLIGAELDYTMAKLGSSKPSFETIVASGVRSTYAHGEPSEKKVEVGDMLTLDFGATFEGYVSDTTRTIAIGNPDSRMEEFYQYVIEAEKNGLETIADGVTSGELDAAIRKVFLDHDVNQYLYHGVGHSIGLEVHEAPYITFRAGRDDIFKKNMVQTIEPGLYLPGVGGMRVEDDIIVQDGKGIQITTSPKSDLIKLPFK